MSSESPAVIIFDQDGYAIQAIQDADGYYRLAVDSKVVNDPFSTDRDKLVAVNFGKTGISTSNNYVFINLEGVGYKHDFGTKAIVSAISANARKSNVGAKWEIQLAVVLRIDGTDADLGILPFGAIQLKDTNTFNQFISSNYFPNVINLEVSGGDFVYITNGFRENNVSGINTATTIKDVLDNDVIPAVGDVLIRITEVVTGGTLDFAYSMQYWVE